MDRMSRGLLALLAGVLLLIGCGGDDSPACEDFTGCGGDLVGTWKASSICGSAVLSEDSCPMIPVDFGGIKVTGELTFNADLSYRSAQNVSGSMLLHWPKSCLVVQGVTLTCRQLNDGIKATMSPDDEFSSITCADESAGCACTAVMKPFGEDETGRYEIVGRTVRTTPAQPGSEVEMDEYCVKDRTLRVRPPLAEPGASTHGSLTYTR